MIDHDVKSGPLTRCQITGSDYLFEAIDLGHQPPCDAILSYPELDAPEVSYPLRLNICPSSGLAQLDYVVDGKMIYPASYPYKAGISQTVIDAHREMAQKLIEKLGGGVYVDIGCNDGTLLRCLRDFGAQVYGVEPTGIAEAAYEHNLEVVNDFFSEDIARAMVQASGQADVITMTHVFAHMADLGEVMRGIHVLMKSTGALVVENQYLLDVLEKDQFDTIYHEHIRTYSLKSLRLLFSQYGLEVFDVERVSRYGGNIRVFVGTEGYRPVSRAVWDLSSLEEQSLLFDELTWKKWRARVLKNRDNFMEWLCRQHRYGVSVAGCSAPGRASTLLNFYGVTPDLMPYTGEVPNSLKLGHYYPGCHIPIVPNTRIIQEHPECVVLLAWHYREYISKRLRKEGYNGTIVSPLPELYFMDT